MNIVVRLDQTERETDTTINAETEDEISLQEEIKVSDGEKPKALKMNFQPEQLHLRYK